MKRSDINPEDIIQEIEETKTNKNTNKKTNTKAKCLKSNKSSNTDEEHKQGIYVYKDEIGNKYLYNFHKI